MTEKKQYHKFIYKLWIDDLTPPGMVCKRTDDKGFDSLRLYDCHAIESWPSGITFYVEINFLEDILIGGIHWILVSDKVRLTFAQCEISEVQFLPVQVVDDTTGKDIGQYWAIKVLKELDALDWHHTRWLYPDRVETYEYPVLNIEKEVLKSDIVENIDIFRLIIKGHSSTSIYLSKGVKLCMEKANAAKGILFLPIEVSP